jgi:CelD/BcsL family acetyltransferase involved in cellulose biosynthesis
MTAAVPYPLRFQIGARTVLTAQRRLVRVALSLEDALAEAPPALPPLDARAHGYVVNSLPETLMPAVIARANGLRPFVRQSYVRRYADLSAGYDAYLAGFSAKSRSTLLRKSRKFAERSGGVLDVRAFCTPDEVARFHGLARQVSSKSYQERLLDAGLPDGDAEIARMMALAAAGAVRAFLLFLEGEPVSYLYLPARGDTLIYAYLGFDPALADPSPGTVLQLAAMRLLMDEGRFSRLDFTEGEGQHKRLFATGGVPCVDLLLLRPSLGNLGWVRALAGFDRAVAAGKSLLDRPAFRPLIRAIRR